MQPRSVSQQCKMLSWACLLEEGQAVGVEVTALRLLEGGSLRGRLGHQGALHGTRTLRRREEQHVTAFEAVLNLPSQDDQSGCRESDSRESPAAGPNTYHIGEHSLARVVGVRGQRDITCDSAWDQHDGGQREGGCSSAENAPE